MVRPFAIVMWTIIIVCVSAITYGAIQDNNWLHRCHAAGGYDRQKFEGDMPIVVGKVIVMTPEYSNHCIDNGKEVKV